MGGGEGDKKRWEGLLEGVMTKTGVKAKKKKRQSLVAFFPFRSLPASEIAIVPGKMSCLRGLVSVWRVNSLNSQGTAAVKWT